MPTYGKKDGQEGESRKAHHNSNEVVRPTLIGSIMPATLVFMLVSWTTAQVLQRTAC